MPHSQGLSNNPYPEPNQLYFFNIHSNIVFLSTRRPFQRSLSFRCTCYNFESTPIFLHSDYMPYPVPYCGAFSTPHSHPSWAQIFAYNGKWRGLHNEELHSLYRSPNIVRVIKSRRLRWAGHVARMEEGRSVFKILTGKPTGKRP